MGRTNARETDTAQLKTTSVTDPATNAAVSTAILDTYSGVIITTTEASNAQTLQDPTNTSKIKRFSVIINDTSTHAVTVNGVELGIGVVRYFIWDGDSWATDNTASGIGDMEESTYDPAGISEQLVGLTATQILTNKRITERTNTIASSATPTPAGDTTDVFTVTALAAAAEFAAPTGTPTNGQVLLIRIRDNATLRALSFNAIYEASSDLPLPTTTIASKTLYLQFVYNSTAVKWQLLGKLDNFSL